jgi:hypothetical protein
MARLVAGMASSHAFAFMDHTEWDVARERNRGFYERRYGFKPPEHPGVATQTAADAERQQQAVSGGLDRLRERIAAERPDVLVVIGDDQNENFTEANLPQMAIYTGESFLAVDRAHPDREPRRYRSQPELAWEMLVGCTNQGYELAAVKEFPEDKLLAHAIAPALDVLVPDGSVPVILLFVEAIRVPSPTPERCYGLGQALRRVIDGWNTDARVMAYASGGLSHFTAGFPYKHYSRKYGHDYGAISEDFDRQVLADMAAGRGSTLAAISADELLEHGDVELRSWITLLGMVGDTPAEILAYEPAYRALMGMGVAWWGLNGRA